MRVIVCMGCSGILCEKMPENPDNKGFRASCHELTCAKATQTRIGIFKTNEENEKFKNLDGVSSNASPTEKEKHALRVLKAQR